MELSTARAQAVLKLFPAINLFTLFDTVLLLVYFWNDVEQSLLLGWALWSLVHCVFWWGYAARTLDRVSVSTPRILIVHALSEGLLFAVLMVLVFPLILPEKAVVLGAFATGMMAAGALSKMTLPAASLTFVGILTGGTNLSLALSTLPQVWIPIVLLTTFGVALSVLALAMSRNFDGRVLAEREVERQKTMVSLLLQDFEESASEGLWEADTQGRLTYVSPRLTELLGGELQGRQEWAPFLRSGKAFRHQVVAAEVAGQRRWWSLTGKPLTDVSGTVTGWRGVGSDITGARELELEAIRLSRFDNLTGLLNRHAFRQLLDTLFEAGPPTDRTLVLIDLVGFRGINESRGHQFGDELLQAVARRLQTEVDDSWTLARLDGDEFALQGETHGLPTQTQATLKVLLAALIQPYTIGKDRFEVAFRLGTARAPVDAASAELWLRCANLALRSAKGDGRTSLVPFTPDLLSSFLERNRLRDLLQSAIDRSEFTVVYQPLIGLKQGLVVGFEALARWNWPEKGAVSPGVFIPLAEESECILKLGLWVLESALREAQTWPRHLEVSVNISGVQLGVPSIADDVLEVIRRVGFDPKRLILEITESALVRKDEHLGTTLRVLKDQGIRLALDDFGTGYSALSYLQEFPFDKLKIDQSFVRHVGTAQGSPALLSSIVGLARALGLSITGEGIETVDQREILKALDCDDGQGYLFSRPLPAGALRGFIEEAS